MAKHPYQGREDEAWWWGGYPSRYDHRDYNRDRGGEVTPAATTTATTTETPRTIMSIKNPISLPSTEYVPDRERQLASSRLKDIMRRKCRVNAGINLSVYQHSCIANFNINH